jgi:TonB family protein
MKKYVLIVVIMLGLLMVAGVEAQTWKAGEKVTATLNGGTLRIIGTGPMAFYGAVAGDIYIVPWYRFTSSITGVIIGNGVTSISGFVGTNLTSITIPNSVTYIGEEAFSGCTGLTSVTIPNSVTSIGAGAFSGCTGLTSVTIPNSVTHIDGSEFSGGAFYGCTGLTSVTIPNSVTSIGQGAFSGCVGLTSITISNGVISIGNSAFSGCTGLKSITIPNSVTSIGEGAFSGCTGLKSVTIGSGVTSIGEGAFYGCTGLKSVTIGSGVTSIGERAFYGCTGLTAVTIPNSVTSIGEEAFYGYTGLEVAADNPNYNSENGILFNKYKTVLIKYPESKQGTYTIPNSVKSIGQGAFSGCVGLTSITIPNNVTSIGNNAFQRCTGLTSVTIPNSVTSIGQGAFYGCKGLTTLIILNQVPYKNIIHDITTIRLYVPQNSVAAYRSAYGWNAVAVTSLDSLKVSIGELSPKFNSEVLNYTLTIPYNDSTLTITAKLTHTDATITGAGMKVLKVGNNVFKVSVTAFNSTSTYTITVNRVTEGAVVGTWNCGPYNDRSAVTATLRGDGTLTVSGKGEISNISTSLNGFITRVVIEDGVTSIGNSTFSGCIGLTSIMIPNSVTSIGQMAFSGCTGLTSITIPNSVTSIGQMAFSGCTGLTSITIPNSVTSIGQMTFSGCTGLKSIMIGRGVTSIGNGLFGIFGNCTGLISIEVAAGNANYSSENGVLFNKDKTVLMEYPKGKQGTYTIPNSVTSIGQSAFFGCKGLTSVTIPNSVTSIGQIAFFGCNGLTSVTIPNSVTSIGQNAFSGCTGLTSVITLNPIPQTLGQFAVYAFAGINMANACLYVPSSSIDAYRSAIGWNAFRCINDKWLINNEPAPTPVPTQTQQKPTLAPPPVSMPIPQKPTPPPPKEEPVVREVENNMDDLAALFDAPPAPIQVSAPSNFKFHWYLNNVRNKIESNWRPRPATEDRIPYVVVRFVINSDGSTMDISVDKSSGYSKLDNLAVKAVTTASPFGKLPPGFSGEKLDISCTLRPTRR